MNKRDVAFLFLLGTYILRLNYWLYYDFVLHSREKAKERERERKRERRRERESVCVWCV